MPYDRKGSTAKLGTGARFKALVGKLRHREGVDNPAALAAWIGRKKYGRRFQKMAASARRGR